MFYIHLYEKLPNIRSVSQKLTKLCYFTGNGKLAKNNMSQNHVLTPLPVK